MRAQSLLLAEGIDPEAADWSLVPANPAQPRPLSAERSQAFAAHLRRVMDEVRAHREPERAATPERAEDTEVGTGAVPDGTEAQAQVEAFARACSTCRGWCCRRGGTHAFLDARSLQRVRDQHPDTRPEELERRYLGHLGPTHLDGGCVYQGDTGCRLPRALRSDTCNRWLCDDLLDARRRWRRGSSDPDVTRFVAVPPRNPRDAS
jgi:hypothetical protein